MLITALWVLDAQAAFVRKHFSYTDPDPESVSNWEAMTFGMLSVGAIVQSAVITQLPYYSIYRAQTLSSWAVDDIAYSRGMAARHGSRAAKYETMTYWNYAPRTRTFAARGGARFVATKVASRFLGPIGVALLMVDAWHTGIWIGEKLFGEMD